LKRAAAVYLLAAATTAVHAGRPLTTEDASVLEDKACQLESWIDRSREATQAWAVPACNFGAGIEWQAGFARSWGDSRSFLSSAYVQAKTVLREPQPGSFGVGVVAGLTRTPTRSTHRGYEDPYGTGIVTVPAGTTTLVHANAGWSRDRERGTDSFTWGLAAEHAVTERWSVVAEAFGDDRTRPFYRAGARVTAVKGLDFDLTVVTRSGGSRADRYLSAGFTWQSAPFLP
jgi:hypothetical protein